MGTTLAISPLSTQYLRWPTRLCHVGQANQCQLFKRLRDPKYHDSLKSTFAQTFRATAVSALFKPSSLRWRPRRSRTYGRRAGDRPDIGRRPTRIGTSSSASC
jgi:hypothetical protein